MTRRKLRDLHVRLTIPESAALRHLARLDRISESAFVRELIAREVIRRTPVEAP